MSSFRCTFRCAIRSKINESTSCPINHMTSPLSSLQHLTPIICARQYHCPILYCPHSAFKDKAEPYRGRSGGGWGWGLKSYPSERNEFSSAHPGASWSMTSVLSRSEKQRQAHGYCFRQFLHLCSLWYSLWSWAAPGFNSWRQRTDEKSDITALIADRGY